MSIPALRQPKPIKKNYENVEKYVIVTLKDGGKLVVSSDSYNGILTVVDGFKCILCCANLSLDSKCKEKHKVLASHLRILERYPHQEQFGANLIRGINKDICYCSICNVTMPTHMVMLHTAAERHLEELEKAYVRAGSYLPTDANNNIK